VFRVTDWVGTAKERKSGKKLETEDWWNWASCSRWSWHLFSLVDERDLILEKWGQMWEDSEDSEDLGLGAAFCLRLWFCISVGCVAAFPSALVLHFLRLRFYISLGSDASWDWVRTLHLLRFGWDIAVGSDGPLKDCDL